MQKSTLLLLSMLLVAPTDSWSPAPPFTRRLQSVAASVAIAASQFGFMISLQDPALAVDIASPQSIPSAVVWQQQDETALRNTLNSPTDDQPQIKFSGNRPNVIDRGTQVLPQKAGKSPILQGLVYVQRENSRPDLSDTLVLTAGTPADPEVVLAGAKFPIAKARFPMQFSMYDENIIPGREEEWARAKDGDIVVTARVCPDGAKLPCSDGESTFKARGISKMIGNLPGMMEGDVVRTASSLPLR